MKRASIFLLSLLLVGTAGITGAHAQKPTLAVLVVGMETDAKGDAFAAGLGNDLNRNGDYELATKDNNPAVAAKLTTLRTQHTGGTKVDTTGLTAWGKTSGVDFVQLVVENTATIITEESKVFIGVEQVAQLVDCSTGKLSGRGTYRMSFIPSGATQMPNLFMVPVTGGVFEMGCKSGRDGTCVTNETPLHYVKVNDFRIGKYEVTQALWKYVMGSLPSSITSTYLGDNKPVIYVSYDDIVGTNGFLDKLNALTGLNFRLPTEA
jgi:formylglycine-generating enzyme required for sulfatase activity